MESISYPFIHYINCSFLLPIEKRLNSEPIRQIFNKTEVCLQALPQGGQTCILDSLSVGRIPSRLYLLCQVCKFLSTQSLNAPQSARFCNKFPVISTFKTRSPCWYWEFLYVPNLRVLVINSQWPRSLWAGHHADIGCIQKLWTLFYIFFSNFF